ncbi:unnamed protein product, partial [Ectocarpus fasciculatus]
ERTARVAVIGGGIAGHGCAYSLGLSERFNVTLFEEREDVGGNAKTFDWSDGVCTGLSVLAWPSEYFRNYNALLHQLGVESTYVELPFFIKDSTGHTFFHGNDFKVRPRHKNDFRKWVILVGIVRTVNSFFAGTKEKSLYHVSILNPFNMLSLRMMCRLCFISSDFWDCVIVPLYMSSFLTIKLDEVPAVILPTLDDLISVSTTPKMQSWKGSSKDVFSRMANTCKFESCCGQKVLACVRNDVTLKWSVITDKREYMNFDKIVFATNSYHAMAAQSGLPFLERCILSNIRYTDDDDDSFSIGIIHSDSSVLPKDCGDDLLHNYANYVEARSDGRGSKCYTNTFILSSWLPILRGEDNDERRSLPRLVTYGTEPKLIEGKQGTVKNFRNHPKMCSVGLASAMAMRYIQGNRGVFYCGSCSTPGNGHDLSLCSGIAIAIAMGASYPFPHDAAAERDFKRLKTIMGL